MLTYNDLYEYLRKEKNAEQLQPLPRNFVSQFSEYLSEKKKQFSGGDEFSPDSIRERKQFENALALFKELMLRRKKKILDLVFVAAETGLMKKDYVDMLSFEQELFEDVIKSVEVGERKLNDMLNGKGAAENDDNKMILAREDIEEFVDLNGGLIGPFRKGEFVNIDGKIADILVSGGKAMLVDDKD